jgi:hypothetical protein
MKKVRIVFSLLFVCGVIWFSQGFHYPGARALNAKPFTDTIGCSYKGFKLYGKIKIVDAFPDIKVQIVESFPDLKVKVVDHFPDDCGEWQFVDSFPDTKIQFVEYFPDIKIKFVESFPGRP